MDCGIRRDAFWGISIFEGWFSFSLHSDAVPFNDVAVRAEAEAAELRSWSVSGDRGNPVSALSGKELVLCPLPRCLGALDRLFVSSFVKTEPKKCWMNSRGLAASVERETELTFQVMWLLFRAEEGRNVMDYIVGEWGGDGGAE
ncbi:sorting nexin-10B isoform X2 [Scyliorhinus canicula]|uniref:sorting nexin-10B isoform X2 n=1 Tax=Scyliorhinus canicula TaxID=7830 RepID=UPI0018F4F1D9|nr:sorting nexin-10B isoform X2 [Scyliorhinus canicula]